MSELQENRNHSVVAIGNNQSDCAAIHQLNVR